MSGNTTDEIGEQFQPPAPPLRQRVRIMIGLLVLLVLMGVMLGIGASLIQFEKVISESMEPTLMVGDILVADANAVPRRYDAVCLWDPTEEGEKLVKRIIGMPGDRIVIRDGIIYVNGREEYSPFIPDNRISWRNIKVDVPENEVFVLGDNRNNSFDSLNFGTVTFERLRGVAEYIVWPPAHWGRIRNIHEDGEEP
jgi:signal peptidase I